MSRKASWLVLPLLWAASALLGALAAVLRGPRCGRVLVGLGAALLLGVAITVSCHRSTPASTGAAARAAGDGRVPLAGENKGGAGALPHDYDPTAPEPPARLTPLSPTAPWLSAAPTPVLVEVAVDEARTSRERITPAGDQLRVATADGTAITLSVPPEALAHSQELSLTVVSRIAGLPFGGALVAAVRITPDNLSLRVPATLTFEPRNGLGQDTGLAGFAIRDGRELHLHRADRIEDAKAKGRGRVELPLARLGSYGVAHATAGEVAAVTRHVPSGYIARLEQLIAQAFPPVNQPSGQASRWSLFPVVYAQEAPSGLPPWLSNLFRSFEESYEQVVVPQFRSIPEHGCEGVTSWAAVDTYLQWTVLPALLFPVERAGTGFFDYWKMVNQRVDMLHARGYSDAQIAEIDAAMDAFRKQRLTELMHRGDPLLTDAYRRLFAKMYECCRWGRPMQYQYDWMVDAMRSGQIAGVTPLDPDENVKLSECACRIASVKEGAPEIWTGTITHIEDYDAEKVQTPGSRTKKQSLLYSYRQELRLDGVIGPGSMRAYYTVQGRKSTHAETTDRYSCGNVVNAQDLTGSARDDGATAVTVAAQRNQPGKYRIGYSVNGADGSAIWKKHWSAVGCQIFNPVRDDSGLTSVTVIGAEPDSGLWIDSAVDPARPYRLSGSRVIEVRDKFFDTPHGLRVKWTLERCGG